MRKCPVCGMLTSDVKVKAYDGLVKERDAFNQLSLERWAELQELKKELEEKNFLISMLRKDIRDLRNRGFWSRVFNLG